MSETNDIRSVVREKYGEIAAAKRSGCGCETTSPADACCGDTSLTLGYTEEQMAALPEGADLGLGCGNPLAHAEVKPGETRASAATSSTSCRWRSRRSRSTSRC